MILSMKLIISLISLLCDTVGISVDCAAANQHMLEDCVISGSNGLHILALMSDFQRSANKVLEQQ